jgi:hypothetical protein
MDDDPAVTHEAAVSRTAKRIKDFFFLARLAFEVTPLKYM